ncbi:MAG: ECF transporter S component [Anaerolineae bacterium]|nr:ECF transporter S component [Anaerolineae bacterium]
MRRLLGWAIYVLSVTLGILAFLYPFFLPDRVAGQTRALQGQIAPLLTAALVGLSVLALWVEVQGQTLSAKTVALMGVLVAVASALRFIEVAIPMPGGFSPIFAPIILAGYALGARFGFLMGALTLLASALLTGGVGPWLPFQMFTAGWIGLTAGWLPRWAGRWERPMLCAFGFIWGILYGVIINLYFWPLAQGPSEQSWAQGLTLKDTLIHYASFYLLTSFVWDLARAAGNAALLLLLSTPALKILARFHRRFHFEVERG